MYPGWLMRIYHDNTINKSIICEVECLKDQTSGQLIDNTDFCNVEQIPSNNSIWDGSYMHAMYWRWLPIGDHFVDIFSSRDSDSYILQREIDSVNSWMNSTKAGHIMRDHYYHDVVILGSCIIRII